MYHHVVMFRLRDPATREHAVALLESLRDQVPSLRTLVIGADDSPSERSSDLCLITAFDDRAGYEAYHHHPFHQDLLTRFGPLVAEARKVDW